MIPLPDTAHPSFPEDKIKAVREWLANPPEWFDTTDQYWKYRIPIYRPLKLNSFLDSHADPLPDGNLPYIVVTFTRDTIIAPRPTSKVEDAIVSEYVVPVYYWNCAKDELGRTITGPMYGDSWYPIHLLDRPLSTPKFTGRAIDISKQGSGLV